ncbi:hypothetical protein O181_054207 [Austropuccinia psidii MF-1]|uniref:Integrase zinc-binding domain-containing protein n=1 Tax=Austropuccinia psidii MF-1 TaxID=1389203 RepID=A0A9Q3E6F7_9BASI|nr:hypothetical protein [Austropuccinia psidii MF-1]
MDLGVLRKVGHNEQVEVTTPVIITWHNGKSKMVGDFRALNTYTIPDRYPIPRIHETLTQLSQAKFITTMDALKCCSWTSLTRQNTREGKTCSWWLTWKKDVAEYCQTCDRCQKANRAAGKNFGIMIQIQEPKSPWEIDHLDWVTALPPGGERSYNARLILVDRYRKKPMFLPFHKDNTAMDTAIMYGI